MQQCNTNTQIIIIFGLKFGLQFRCELQKLQKKKKNEQMQPIQSTVTVVITSLRRPLKPFILHLQLQ